MRPPFFFPVLRLKEKRVPEVFAPYWQQIDAGFEKQKVEGVCLMPTGGLGLFCGLVGAARRERSESDERRWWGGGGEEMGVGTRKQTSSHQSETHFHNKPLVTRDQEKAHPEDLRPSYSGTQLHPLFYRAARRTEATEHLNWSHRQQYSKWNLKAETFTPVWTHAGIQRLGLCLTALYFVQWTTRGCGSKTVWLKACNHVRWWLLTQE